MSKKQQQKKISKLEMIMEDLRMRTTLELRGYKLCMRVGKMEGLTEREQEDRINMILDLYQLYGNNVINLLEGECVKRRWEGKPKRKSKKKKILKKVEKRFGYIKNPLYLCNVDERER